MAIRDIVREPILEWLLEPTYPSIRAFTLANLLDRPADDPEVEKWFDGAWSFRGRRAGWYTLEALRALQVP